MKPIGIPWLISFHLYCIFEDLLTWVWTLSVSAHVITNVSMIKLNNWRVIQTCLKMRYPSSFTWRDAITQLAATLLHEVVSIVSVKKNGSVKQKNVNECFEWGWKTSRERQKENISALMKQSVSVAALFDEKLKRPKTPLKHFLS